MLNKVSKAQFSLIAHSPAVVTLTSHSSLHKSVEVVGRWVRMCATQSFPHGLSPYPQSSLSLFILYIFF